MSLEKALHEWWAAEASLRTWIAPDRFFTGHVTDGELPYGTLWRLGSRVLWRTGAGDLLEEVGLRLRLWHPDYQAVRAIVEHVRRVWDRSSFRLEEGGQVAALLIGPQTYRQERKGAWLAEVALEAQVYWPPQD